MKPLADRKGKTIGELFDDTRGMDAAMKRGVRRALAAQKKAPVTRRAARRRKAA